MSPSTWRLGSDEVGNPASSRPATIGQIKVKRAPEEAHSSGRNVGASERRAFLQKLPHSGAAEQGRHNTMDILVQGAPDKQEVHGVRKLDHETIGEQTEFEPLIGKKDHQGHVESRKSHAGGNVKETLETVTYDDLFGNMSDLLVRQNAAANTSSMNESDSRCSQNEETNKDNLERTMPQKELERSDLSSCALHSEWHACTSGSEWLTAEASETESLRHQLRLVRKELEHLKFAKDMTQLQESDIAYECSPRRSSRKYAMQHVKAHRFDDRIIQLAFAEGWSRV